MANYVYIMARMRFFFISSPSLAVPGKHGTRHDMSMNMPRAVSDWLISHSRPLVALPI